MRIYKLGHRAPAQSYVERIDSQGYYGRGPSILFKRSLDPASPSYRLELMPKEIEELVAQFGGTVDWKKEGN